MAKKKAQKVLIFTRHQEEFSSRQFEYLRNLHGENARIEFDDLRFKGSEDEKKSQCVNYFKKKVEDGYVCYVVLSANLKTALVFNMIPFRVIFAPRKVRHASVIKVEDYLPNPKKSIMINVMTNMGVEPVEEISEKRKRLSYRNKPRCVRKK